MFEQIFGEYLVSKDYITAADLESVLAKINASRVKLGLIAVAQKMLTKEQADRVNMLQQQRDKRFGDIAVAEGYITDAQVGELLSLQGNPYMKFVQAVTELGLMTMERVEEVLDELKADLNLTDDELAGFKSGDVDKIIDIFVKTEGFSKIYLSLLLRNIVRHITPEFSFSSPVTIRDYSFKHLSTQCIKGEHHIFAGFGCADESLTVIANHFAKENFTVVDEDTYDAVCEFINCINGLFATRLSEDGIEIDMLPPLFYNSGKLTASKDIILLPLKIKGQCVDFILAIDADVNID